MTEKYLYRFRMTGEGKKDASMGKDLAVAVNGRDAEEQKSVTKATVCYETEGGSRHYRTYPVTEESLRKFSSV